MVSDPFRTRPAGVSTIEEILLRVLPALAGATVPGAFVRLGSDSFPSFGGSVKTRPASAARPLLPDRTCQLLSASLFQGVAKRHERLLSFLLLLRLSLLRLFFLLFLLLLLLLLVILLHQLHDPH